MTSCFTLYDKISELIYITHITSFFKKIINLERPLCEDIFGTSSSVENIYIVLLNKRNCIWENLLTTVVAS